jgi:macrolide transport system ATP-binding/permease protein
MSAVLSAYDLVKSYGPHRVLDGLNIAAVAGQRVGLVGENGTGKSTLLRILAGIDEPDRGQVTRPADIGFLHQELPHPPHATIADLVDEALSDVRTATARLQTLAEQLRRRPADTAALADYGELLQWVDDYDAWDADRRADLVLAGLGLGAAGRDRRIGTLSGGERSRLGLAVLLIRQPRALLLDEPTNHLDDQALEFLQAHLTGLPGTVVLASHDRVFLDAVCTGILDLDPARGGPTWYGGAYSDYLQAKRTERHRWQDQYGAQQRELAELRRAVRTTARQVAPGRAPRDRNKTAYDRHGERVQSQVSRRVRNAHRRLDELTRDQVRRPPPPLRFAATLTSDAGSGRAPVAVSLRDVDVPGRLRVERMQVPSAGRLLVTGANGAGKSTLLHVLAGRLAPASGTVAHRRGLRVGLLEQEVTFADPQRSPRQLYADRAPAAGVPLTDLGLVAPRDLDRPVGALSVGQRRRLALALLVARPPDLLLLDEPTNHISLTLAEELQEALATASGAVVAASHDRWLRRRWDGPALALANGRLLDDVDSPAGRPPGPARNRQGCPDPPHHPGRPPGPVATGFHRHRGVSPVSTSSQPPSSYSRSS